MTPTHIGRYEILSELGRGGMAIVYLARDPLIKRQVALIVLPRQFTFDPEFRARFQREAEAIAALEHPAIVPVYDYGEHDEQPYIVMRYMPGGSLADRLARGALSLSEASRILDRLARGLDRAHARGIVHRDLKPGNILFDEDDNPYIADFGIARLAETTLSLTHGLIGTPQYMSPEQFQADKTLDGRSDVYSLGVILFEMLAGRQPYRADTPAQLMKMHLLDPVPRILDARPDLPPSCDALIARAMAKDREARFGSAGELARAMGQLATQPPPVAKVVEAPTVIEPLPPSAPRPGHPATPPPPPAAPASRRPAETADLTRASPGTGAGKPPHAGESPKRPKPGRTRRTWVIGGVVALGLAGVWLLSSLFNPPLATPTAPPGPTSVQPTTTSHFPTLPPSWTSTPTAPTDTPTEMPAPTDTPLPALAVGATQVYADGMIGLYVPAGEFLMGSSESDALAQSDEKPQHAVDLDAFWIDRTEVTNAMYALCVEAGACQPPAVTSSYTRTSYYSNTQFDNYPVIYVDWNSAKAYCEWADRRLPTEAEWEKAARGTDGRKYPWGFEPPNSSLLNYDSDVADTTEVGVYPDGASTYGALDMAGNVWEWMADWYAENFYENSPSENPTGPSSGDYRGLRGGTWGAKDNFVRAAARNGYGPTGSSYTVGFRCSRGTSP